ncbi:hypothetical protein PHYBLDRAFT_147272 [Phycomyces blakesleeanus NRRL 1555(-)]|uniref:Uncharacterized protein n=1 Tax=Phycomyces blakesleeanus (strain ATCC 8743b / DSM 1359 / FGSC 10004 / NBRC 33097 / NRRL 1555) TaxID=763407 RepID=A0A162U1B7_PHYB8|nr:hypothetical protein PHYBLDRAFT_147272 [Phycomyces blakesleeanus NRRL 1555(-)]OAD71523.1 hypothetical protein PHYBLDRAFT_147272 [Phycomyces blakesleeanus NRRL 1555(-)]|eukprot:XP_018289563.1 hypothetical protein PHYBLDRAFT_147272 [Phycomyces blakesleeanus NRRL 1555(-)]
MTEIDQSILDDVDMYHDENDTSNEDESAKLMSIHLSQLMLQHRIARAAYTDIVQFINTVIEGRNDIMMEPGTKISYSKTVDTLLKSKSSCSDPDTQIVFQLVRHYLVDIPYIIKQQGPLQCYSTCSMERQFAIHNYISMAISICDEIKLIQPKSYRRESYINLSNDSSGVQLWELFHQFVNLNNDLVKDVGGPSVKEALLIYYQRPTDLTGHEFGDSVVVVAAHLWIGLTHVDFYGFLHFLAFMEVMKEHDAADHNSLVPIVKQQSQSTHTLGYQM